MAFACTWVELGVGAAAWGPSPTGEEQPKLVGVPWICGSAQRLFVLACVQSSGQVIVTAGERSGAWVQPSVMCVLE